MSFSIIIIVAVTIITSNNSLWKIQQIIMILQEYRDSIKLLTGNERHLFIVSTTYELLFLFMIQYYHTTYDTYLISISITTICLYSQYHLIHLLKLCSTIFLHHNDEILFSTCILSGIIVCMGILFLLRNPTTI